MFDATDPKTKRILFSKVLRRGWRGGWLGSINYNYLEFFIIIRAINSDSLQLLRASIVTHYSSKYYGAGHHVISLSAHFHKLATSIE